MPAKHTVLARSGDRLELRVDGGTGIYLKLADAQRRVLQGRRLALAKACGVRLRLRVLDGMAGFGLDGLTLALLGCDVLMIERNPVLFTLLQDALAGIRARVEMSGTVECRQGDVRDVLAEEDSFDTIYLDPMFSVPDKAALPRRSAQVLADLIGPPDDDLAEVVARATGRARLRVVVKRRRLDATCAPPDWQIVGRRVRFDVYRGGAGAVVG